MWRADDVGYEHFWGVFLVELNSHNGNGFIRYSVLNISIECRYSNIRTLEMVEAEK